MKCESIRSFFRYETPKVIEIRSVFIGVISRLIQLGIVCYIIGYVLLYKKGYQEFSQVESSVTTKVKGVAFSNFSKEAFNVKILHPEWYRRIWDIPDIVIPPQENGATFVATNVIITANQSQGKCSEDSKVYGALCDPHDNKCMRGHTLPLGNGVMTGKCIKNNETNTLYTCEVRAWCPVELRILPLNDSSPLIAESENFTILIKNYVNFPKFKDSNRRNIKDTSNTSYLASCLYDEDNTECPVFKLGDIVKWTDYSYDEVASKGAVIVITITWNCDLDYDKKYCFPTYTFNRLDDSNLQIATGWNLRFANYYGDKLRTLYEVYGIRINIIVVGQAGKFRIVPLLQNVGAGLALLAVEVVICDFVALYLVKKRKYYKSKKYEEVGTETDPVHISKKYEEVGTETDPEDVSKEYEEVGAKTDREDVSDVPQVVVEKEPSPSPSTEKHSSDRNHKLKD